MPTSHPPPDPSAAPVLHLNGLRKVYRVRERRPGLRGALRGLFHAPAHEVVALHGLDLTVAAGERVAFLGPNGAGKSTTIKLLTGILTPSAGSARVLGLDPVRDRRALAARIGTVFGQRSTLWFHLPARDAFDLLRHVYGLDPAEHRRRLAELVEAFEVGGLVDRPVRRLSLGERMRMELVASLLPRPEVLFLDEPTIGLDVTAKAVIRDLVRRLSARDGTTVLLTSHDTGDIESVCDRAVVIHHGRLLLDRPVAALRRTYLRTKWITLHTEEPQVHLDLPGVRVHEQAPHRARLAVDLAVVPVDHVVAEALRRHRLTDLSVEDPPMEEIIQAIYAGTGPVDGAGGAPRPPASPAAP